MKTLCNMVPITNTYKKFKLYNLKYSNLNLD